MILAVPQEEHQQTSIRRAENGGHARSTSRSKSRTRNSSSNSHHRHTGKPKRRLDKGFLRNKLWLLGFGLMNGGELCNFLAYAFAPPSVVAPLGMVTLVANVFLAPLVVREVRGALYLLMLLSIRICSELPLTSLVAAHSRSGKRT